MKNDIELSHGSPESFGWQRRPNFDTPTGLAYEKPTGELMLFPRSVPQPSLVKLKDRGSPLHEDKK